MGVENQTGTFHLTSYPGPSGGAAMSGAACRDVGSCNQARSRPPMADPRRRM